MRYGTWILHNGNEFDPHTGALSIPIYQVSTFHQNDIDNPGKYDYSSSVNHVATEDIYGGSYRILSKFFSKFGIQTTFVDMSRLENIEKAIQPNTKILFLETPSNPLLKITDIAGVVQIVKRHHLMTMIDNTFMSPYFQHPLDLGVDLVIHSATKFLGGHSDVIGGAVITNSMELTTKVYFVQNGFGAILGPQDSWLLLRGSKRSGPEWNYNSNPLWRLPDG